MYLTPIFNQVFIDNNLLISDKALQSDAHYTREWLTFSRQQKRLDLLLRKLNQDIKVLPGSNTSKKSLPFFKTMHGSKNVNKLILSILL